MGRYRFYDNPVRADQRVFLVPISYAAFGHTNLFKQKMTVMSETITKSFKLSVVLVVMVVLEMVLRMHWLPVEVARGTLLIFAPL